MTIPITPESVRAVYECLHKLPPFSRWDLPSANKLHFAVDHLLSIESDYNPNPPKTLRVSNAKVSTFLMLVIAVAHEMAHVRQDVAGKWPAGNPHNAYFKRLTRQICKNFPFFDPLTF